MKVHEQPGHIDQIKQVNLGTVYRLIDQNEPISRISISKRAQLAPASITKITRELTDAHLIKETEFPELGFRGRPAVGLKIDSEGWQFLCLRITNNQLILALREINSHLLTEKYIDFSANSNEEFILKIEQEMDLFFAQNADILERLTAISITLNATIKPKEGILISSPYYPINNLPITEILTSKIGLPVYIQHEFTAWTLAEFYFGAAKQCENFIQIVIDEHVGAAIVTDGHLLHAGSHSLVEIGHINTIENGIQCYCGNYGCLETVIGLKHLLNKTSVDSFCHAVLNNETEALEIVNKIGFHLGKTVAILINIFNPDLIVIGSPLNSVQTLLYPILKRYIQANSLADFNKDIEIIPAQYNNLGTLSTAALVKEALYDGSLLIKLMAG